jgi:16S rRNA (guanine(966)-N(2))-methyltransferase RsmD
LRVISGDKKGHRLKAPKGFDVRPTEDKIKESIFNILKPLKIEFTVLDLFAGSGSIGIEFLSRGAKKVYFIDVKQNSIDIIKENLRHTKLEDKSTVLKLEANRALRKFLKDNLKFDYIYLDPPFKNHELLFNVVDYITKHDLLEKNGLILIEHEKELNLKLNINNFYRCDYRNYGSKSISFYKKQEVLK